MEARTEVRLLGPVDAIDAHGSVVPLGGPKERTVLAVLACHAGEAVHADRIIDAIWGELPPRTARKTLHAYVSRLRRALGGGIETVIDGYRLTLPTDRWFVESQILVARGASAAGDHLAAADVLRTAVARWRGESLGAMAHEPFAASTAAQLEELKMACIEERISAELAAGATADLAVELEALCGRHPYRERLWGQRMLVLYRVGRQADALSAYETLRRTLDEELGIDPSPAIRRLHAAILRQDGSLSAGADPAGVQQEAAEPDHAASGIALRPVRYSLNAGREAIAHGDFDDALRILRRGIAVAEIDAAASSGRSAGLLADLHLAVASAGLHAGDADGTRRAAFAAVDIAWRIGSPERAAQAALLLQRWSMHGLSDPALRALFEETLAALEPASALRAQVLAGFAGYLCWCEGDMTTGRAIQQEAIGLADATGDRVALFDALTLRTWGETHERVDADGLLSLAEEIGDPTSLAIAHRNRLVGSLRNGDRDRAEQDRAALIAQADGDFLHARNNSIMETCFAVLDGRFQDAESLAFEMLTPVPGLDLPGAVALAFLAVEMGRSSTAVELLEAMLVENPTVVGVRAVLAVMYAQLGDHQRARELLGPLTADGLASVPRDASFPATLGYLATAAAITDDTTAGEAVREQLELRTEAVLLLPGGITCAGPRCGYLGLAELSTGEVDAAIGNLEEAVRVAGAMRSPPMLATSKLWLADALLRRGDPEDEPTASGLLEDAATTAQGLGMTWVAERARSLRG